jgi:rhodanese-related sulfurtransferase
MLGALSRMFRKPLAEPRWIEVADLRRRLASPPAPLVVDVRGPDEFDGPLGHIEGAWNIPFPDLTAHEGDIIGVHRPVVFVCLTDKRSSAAAAQLVRVGLSDASVLHGGMQAWRRAGA